ncbi:class I SAM-dependent methyltransferase [Planomonospora algeriensis]
MEVQVPRLPVVPLEQRPGAGLLPGATVVSVDADPLLLGLGRAAYPRLRFVSADLRTPGWSDSLGLDRPADAAVSTTALHWISAADLPKMYGELATVLRPGGLLLNGDHLETDDATPALARLERALHEREAERRFAGRRPEDWRQWWDAVTADPAFAELHAARTTAGADHHGSESPLLFQHVDALRDAGFTEVGCLWQRGHDRLLCAVRGRRAPAGPAAPPGRPEGLRGRWEASGRPPEGLREGGEDGRSALRRPLPARREP